MNHSEKNEDLITDLLIFPNYLFSLLKFLKL